MDAAKGRSPVLESEVSSLRAALDAVPVPVLSIAADGTVAFANRALARWLAQPARAIRGWPVERLLGPQGGESIRSVLERPVQQSTTTVELTLPGPENAQRRVELTVDAHGRIGELPTAATVSLIERPTAIGEAGSADLEAMLAAVEPSVFMVDADWTLLRWSPSFAGAGLIPRDRVTQGVDLSGVLSRLVVHRLGPLDESERELPDMASVPGGRLEFQSLLPTGQRYKVEFTAQPDGRVVVMVLDVRDVAQIEEELRRSERMRTIGQLTGGIAHDFNNLLAVVVGNLDLLEDQGLFGEQRSLVQAAKRSALRGASLTGSLLTFQRRAAGQPEPTSATAMVENLERVLRRTLGGQVVVETRLNTKPWLTRVDPGLLENAIVNLAINARDAMPDGGTLTISTENVPDGFDPQDGSGPRDAVVLAVKDTGTGMSEEVLKQATDAFFTTKADGRGTGLGLAMVRRFVRAAEGRIVIHSEEGVGTEVKLILPRMVGEATQDPEEVGRPVLQGQGKHVLLVEDNARVRTTFRVMLQRLGYQVTDVDGPQAAMNLMELSGGSFDVLLIDARFPDGPSGIEVCRRLTASHPQLHALLMSGHPETQRPFGLPVLSKPCTLSALSAVLATLDE